MMHQKIVSLLITPVDREKFAEMPQRRDEEHARTCERLVDLELFWAVPMKLQPADDVFSDLTWSAVCSEMLAGLGSNKRVLIYEGEIVSRNIGEADAASEPVPGDRECQRHIPIETDWHPDE
jgi:hypothetical protein